MTNLNSLFLSQAYKDCWDDYNRSLKLRSFPRWDYVTEVWMSTIIWDGAGKWAAVSAVMCPAITVY